MRSVAFDDRLMMRENLLYKIVSSRRFRFFSSDDDVKRNGIRYLVSRLGEGKKLPTTNDNKCGLSMHLNGAANTEIYRVGYFDSLITNEAFRSEIFLGSRLIEEDIGTRKDGIIDLTTSFPASTDGTKISLLPLHRTDAANHIGVTSVVVTSDYRVLLFRQGDTQVERGSITVASGSLDWNDIVDGAQNDDLQSVIKRGMAREFCEEASARRAYRIHQNMRDLRQIIAHASNEFELTGFFRWVDRCGKPEFVGVAWTPFRYVDLPPDEFEVSAFRLEMVSDFELRRMSDFRLFVDQIGRLITSLPELRLGLSSYVALSRLCEIAEYRGASDPAKRKIYDQIKDRLRLS